MKKNIVIGVTGGIASYKALDVVSMLKKKDFNVDVIMTKNAAEFVNPLSFQTISKNRVITEMFETPKFWEVEHIELAKKADLVLIAPATANCIGKVANGIADDMLTTVVMATKAPVVFAPAMNTGMYENAIYQGNAESLKSKGYTFIDPASGMLACGDEGKGKFPQPEDVVEYVLKILEREEPVQKQDLKGKKILITAGPTIEPIDPVRYISNHSSGKMGFAIAEEANRRGGYVVLVAGPVSLTASSDIKRIDVNTTAEMSMWVNKYYKGADAVIKAAAVADYKAESVASTKIKKNEDVMSINLIKNEDILAGLGQKKEDQILVGFAAETNNLEEYAKDKIKKKNLDFIVANNVSKEGAGFKGDTNIISIFTAGGEARDYPIMSKTKAAEVIIDFLSENYLKVE